MLNADTVSAVKQEALALVEQASDPSALDKVRVTLIGKKGSVTQLMKNLRDVAPDERKSIGELLNQAKTEVEEKISARKSALELAALSDRLETERIDVTLPVDAPLQITGAGTYHPLTSVQRDLERIFTSLGFTVVDGPEIEREYFNFDALNIPDTHPARDMQDTFWTDDGDVLRTHTSCIQSRALTTMKPPLRIVAPGRCFRCERIDSSHEHTFYQMEGMMVDKHVTVGHLIYFMKTLLREIFGEEQKIRLRPGYFPFVEPGFELDIWFRGRWLELLPCGLTHPKVLEHGGIDPNEWQGFAFGLGLTRLVMTTYQIDDIRHFMAGDTRFLKQF